MEVLRTDINGITRALEILRQGGIVAHATETCYGLACDVSNPEAVKKLFAIKQRPLNQPVSALFSSVDEAKKYVEWNDEAQKLADEYLPGPLTLILPLRAGGLHPLPPAPSPLPGRGGGSRKENMYRFYRPSAIMNARGLRKTQTNAEGILWDALRKNQFHNLHFRRQHPIGKYVLDFFCDALALGIELDGSVHDNEEQKEKDADRTAYMKEAGIRVIRFRNNEVEEHLEKVLSVLEQNLPSPAPICRQAERSGGGAGGGGCSPRGVGEGVTLGLRISNHPLAQQLVSAFGSPLSTTSANLHGQPNPYSTDDIVRQFSGQKFQPDLILDSGVLLNNPPSTVIDLTSPDATTRRKGSVQPQKK